MRIFEKTFSSRISSWLTGHFERRMRELYTVILKSLLYSDALTMDKSGQIYGIFKMAVSKRLKKQRIPVIRRSFSAFLFFRFTNALRPILPLRRIYRFIVSLRITLPEPAG